MLTINTDWKIMCVNIHAYQMTSNDKKLRTWSVILYVMLIIEDVFWVSL